MTLKYMGGEWRVSPCRYRITDPELRWELQVIMPGWPCHTVCPGHIDGKCIFLNRSVHKWYRATGKNPFIEVSE